MPTSRSGLGAVVEIDAPAVRPESRLRLVDFPDPTVAPKVVEMPLEVRSYPNATAVSLAPTRKRDNRNIGAVYTAEGDLVEDTQRAKPRRNWWPSPRELPPGGPPEKHLEGRAFYAGRYVKHFGHVLLETMTRLWPDVDYHGFDHLLALPKFVQSDYSGTPDPLFSKLVTLAGAPVDRVTVVVERVVCDELLVPTSPFNVGMAADPRFLDVFDRIGDRVERGELGPPPRDLPRRIYLSRSLLVKKNVRQQRSADNEPAAEERFAARGFQIIHPQTLSLPEQVALCRNAEVIAGCDGSALHMTMFARPGTQLLALDSRAVENQFLIDQARGLDAIHLWAATAESERRVRTWSIDLPRVEAALDLLLDRRS